MYISSFISFIFFLFFFFYFFFIKSSDYQQYQKLSQQKRKIETEKHLVKKTATQKREHVQKDIYLPQDEKKMHFRLASSLSTLCFSQLDDSIDIIEHLSDIHCWIKEKNDSSYNQLRYFIAEKGMYTFPSNQFSGENISLYFFFHSLENFSSPDLLSAYLKGYAKKMIFSLSEKTPHIEVDDFQATFLPKKEKNE